MFLAFRAGGMLEVGCYFLCRCCFLEDQHIVDEDRIRAITQLDGF